MKSTSINACLFVAVLGVGGLAACGGGGDVPHASVVAAGTGSSGGPNASVGSRLGSLTGPIQSVDTPTGVLKVVGMAVTGGATTLVVDARTGSTGPLVLADLRIGDSVQIDFIQLGQVGPSPFHANRIERRNPSTQFEIISTNPGVMDRMPYPIVEDQQTQYFGSCSSFFSSQSPAWGPCSGNEFWGNSAWGNVGIAELTVSGAIRQSDGAPVASVVSVSWS